MPDPQQILSDPDFRSLPPEEKHKVMVRIDPDYAGLPQPEQLKVLSRFGIEQPRTQVAIEGQSPAVTQKPTEGLIGQTLRFLGGLPGPASKLGQLNNPEAQDFLTNMARPIISGAAGTAVGGLSGPAGVITGPATYAATDVALQQLLNKKGSLSGALLPENIAPKPGSALDILANTAEQALGGKVISKVLGGVKGLAKEIYNPGSITGDIYKLNPTYSQYYENMFGKQSWAKTVEDLFANRAKNKAIDTSAKLGVEEADKLANKVAGKIISPAKEEQTSIVREGIENNLKRAVAESNSQAENAIKIAGQDVITIGNKALTNDELMNKLASSPGVEPADMGLANSVHLANIQSGMSPAQSLNMISKSPQAFRENVRIAAKSLIPESIDNTKIVSGPTYLNNIAQDMHDYLEGITNSSLITDAEKPVIAKARDILRSTNAKFDNEGKLTSLDPVSFEDAWNYKKFIDTLGYGKVAHYDKTAIIPGKERLFSDMSDRLNEDIGNSLSNLKNDPKQEALKSWQNAKMGVKQRIDVFGSDGLRQMIENTNDNFPYIDAVINDSHKLQRALVAGELQLPSGKLLSTNVRNDLQGYQVSKLFRDATVPDPKIPDNFTINASKIYQELTDPNMEASLWGTGTKRGLFSAQDRSNIEQFVKQIAITQEKTGMLGPYIKYAWPLRAGFQIGGWITSGFSAYSSNLPLAMGIAGITVSGPALGKILTNPTAARLMIGLAAGVKGGSDPFVARTIIGAIKGTGTSIILNGHNGQNIQGTIDKEGKFIPQEKQEGRIQ